MVRLLALILSFICVLGTQTSCAHAGKAPGGAGEIKQAGDRKPKPIKRIHHEDASNSIDEVRESADTKSIVVKPNNRMPSYDIVPASRHGAPAGRNTQQKGVRMWRLLNF